MSLMKCPEEFLLSAVFIYFSDICQFDYGMDSTETAEAWSRFSKLFLNQHARDIYNNKIGEYIKNNITCVSKSERKGFGIIYRKINDED